MKNAMLEISWRLRLVAFIAVVTIPASSRAYDTGITLAWTRDIVIRRTELIQTAFGNMGRLPKTQSVVMPNVTNPFPAFTNIARVDLYHDPSTPAQGFPKDAHLYVAGPINNGKVVILNPGHQFTCDWTAFFTGYRIQPTLQALLNAGFSVLAMNMPGCGDVSTHAWMFQNYGVTEMQYFIVAAVQAMNYWDAHGSFSEYDMAGLSGGAWTTTITAALDTRIKKSFPVAGGMPGIIPVDPTSYANNDDEQFWAPYYTIAGYLDHYIMGSYGPGRMQLQILNYYDNCCWGAAQWSSTLQNYYGMTYTQYVLNYAADVDFVLQGLPPSNYAVVIDTVADQHQISSYALSLILDELMSSP
jgi:hypothetical protein